MGHYDSCYDKPQWYWEQKEKEWKENRKRAEDFKQFENDLDVALKYNNNELIIKILENFMDSYLFKDCKSVSWGFLV